ncbi:MAG: hypothetical protein JNL67_21110 [Planctomycetaceae bacterium]|nr:hypothetical protein [Planctomycetaceae bacterium]
MRIEAAAESKRIAGIRKVCAGKHPEIEARAIEEGWSVTKTELAVLRIERPIRKQRNELRSQFGFIHLVYSADLRHSNLATEAM